MTIIIDYRRTIGDVFARAWRYPYTAVAMHPETAHQVKRDAEACDWEVTDGALRLTGLVLVEDDTVPIGHFRFQNEVDAAIREV